MIGNYHEMNGWGYQLLNHILALDTTGVTVIPRRLNITNAVNPDLPERLKELEANNDSNPDVVIQNVLPHMLEYSGRIGRNICYYVCETTDFKASGWSSKINLMDEAWVPCYFNKKASLDSGVQIPINVVHQAVNTSKFNQTYDIHKVREIVRDDFIFYTISEFTSRKNVEAIIKAFHLEFNLSEPVQLLIKTTPVGLGDNPMQAVTNKIEKVKRGLRIYPDPHSFKREFTVCGFANDAEVNSIHQSCDCFVSASHGEAWCQPAIDALGFGKVVIAPNWGGFTEYLTEKNSYVVGGSEDHTFENYDSLPSLYTGREKYFNISVSKLRQAMRDAYEKRDLNKKKIEQGKKDVQKFSYVEIGKKMKGLLEK